MQVEKLRKKRTTQTQPCDIMQCDRVCAAGTLPGSRTERECTFMTHITIQYRFKDAVWDIEFREGSRFRVKTGSESRLIPYSLTFANPR